MELSMEGLLWIILAALSLAMVVFCFCMAIRKSKKPLEEEKMDSLRPVRMTGERNLTPIAPRKTTRSTYSAETADAYDVYRRSDPREGRSVKPETAAPRRAPSSRTAAETEKPSPSRSSVRPEAPVRPAEHSIRSEGSAHANSRPAPTQESPSASSAEDAQQIQKLLRSLMQELDRAYPDRRIDWATWDHNRWDRTAGYLTRKLGYARGSEFLHAYGYDIIED